MIPIELRLQNFLSYGEDIPALDFTQFKLACLTGANGHGKSALLDAMTWAVWGEARKAGHNKTPDADLLRQNAEEMFVEFTFALNNREYQVYREYHRKRRSSKLEFRARENRNGAYILLTGNSKRDTQKRIEKTLGLDYRTFINSSFLQQGKADEFTRQPPKDRKEILCNILGLDYYDRLLEETKRRLSETRVEIRTLEDSLDAIQSELAEEDAVAEQEKERSAALLEKEKNLAAMRAEAKQLQEQIAGLEHIREQIERSQEEEVRLRKRLDDLTQRERKLVKEKNDAEELLSRESELQTRFQRYEFIGKELHDLLAIDEQFKVADARRLALEKNIEAQRHDIQVRLASLRSENEQIQKTKSEWKSTLDARAAIERDYSIFEKIAEEQKTLSEKKSTYDSLQKQAQDVEKQIEQERQKFIERIAELRGATQTIPALQKEIERDIKQIVQKPALESDLEKIRAALQKIVDDGQENNRLKDRAAAELDQSQKNLLETKEKLELLQSGQSSECPLCNSSLDQNKRENLLQRFQNEITALQTKIPDLQKQITERDRLREELLKQHQTEEKRRSAQERELNRLSILENDIKNREADLQQKLAQEQQIQKLTDILAQNAYAEEARGEQVRLKREIEQTGYLPERFDAVSKQLTQQRAAEHRWNQLQDILKRQAQSQNRETQLREEIAAYQTQLDSGDFALHEKKQWQIILEEIAPLRLTLEKRKGLQEEQQQLRNALAEWSRATEAKKRLPELELDLRQIAQDRDDFQKRLQEIAAERQKSAPLLQELTARRQKLNALENDLTSIEKERNALQIALGGLRQKLEHIQKRKVEFKEKRERLTILNRDEGLYKTLAAAFSRNGIPAMIVDRALPELENDANALLHQLTGGRCSVAFESQRETRSGGISETLDIKISDEMGTRDYEMFSGGEAFRANLALRIALSQLLCRRAGSKLQLLVIDEGFGTQDSEGVNNIVDAINEIQDDFEKILIVTHLDELKERFPSRIEVVKELGIGSRFEIVHTL